ncbi:AlbA family DNA-binding domain-containing protein, partial [Sphaerotilus sp.]|uniref:AlbA family DNA-binding domain-containing protein n=1 Tax=Sphaerotilus sp. TaxID=2093942 RepID=UPI0025E6DF84
MTPNDLLLLLRQGENSGVEFKRDDLRAEQLAREVVALANFQGGRVIVGVEDDGRISGIQRPDLERWVMDTVFGRFIHPQLLPYYEEITLDTGQRVAVITVLTGTAKPYVLRHNQREDIYVRVGSTSQLATREQQAALFASGGLLHAEVLPVSGSGLADLDQARLTDYLGRVLSDEVPATDADWH